MNAVMHRSTLRSPTTEPGLGRGLLIASSFAGAKTSIAQFAESAAQHIRDWGLVGTPLAEEAEGLGAALDTNGNIRGFAERKFEQFEGQRAVLLCGGRRR